MGRPVTVTIPHALGKDEARRRIDEGFGNLQQQIAGGMAGMLQVKQHWEGDSLHFGAGSLGQFINGRVDVLPDSVQFQIDLPEFMVAIADKIKSRLRDETQKLLEKK